jgi:hypothetical protein
MSGVSSNQPSKSPIIIRCPTRSKFLLKPQLLTFTYSLSYTGGDFPIVNISASALHGLALATVGTASDYAFLA